LQRESLLDQLQYQGHFLVKSAQLCYLLPKLHLLHQSLWLELFPDNKERCLLHQLLPSRSLVSAGRCVRCFHAAAVAFKNRITIDDGTIRLKCINKKTSSWPKN